MKKSLRDAFVGQLSGCDHAVEVGAGREPSVAVALATRGVDVVAVDVHDFPVPDGVPFVRDDVFVRAGVADLGLYVAAEVVYALNAPVEFRRPAAEVARCANADFLFTMLGHDGPLIPVSRESLPGETLYAAEHGRRDQRARWNSPGWSQE